MINNILKYGAVALTVASAYFYVIGSIADKAYFSHFGVNWEAFARAPHEEIVLGFIIFVLPPFVGNMLIGPFVITAAAAIIIYLVRKAPDNWGAHLGFALSLFFYGCLIGALHGADMAKQMSDPSNPFAMAKITIKAPTPAQRSGRIIFQDNIKIALYDMADESTYVYPMSNISEIHVQKTKNESTN